MFLRLPRGTSPTITRKTGAVCELRVSFQWNAHDRPPVQARKYNEALLHAHTAVKKLPESAIVSCLLGFVHLQTPKGDIEVAKKWLCKALRQDPSHRESALALVSIHSQAKDWDAAIAVLERQLLQQPSDLIHQRLGEMHWCAARSHWTPLLVSVTVTCWAVCFLPCCSLSVGLDAGPASMMSRIRRGGNVLRSS